MLHPCCSLALAVLVATLIGCSNEPPTGTVVGSVTLDGQPLEQGNIQFIPVAGDAPTAGADIKHGQFTAVSPVAKMRVQVNASRVVGQRKVYDTPDSPVVDEVVELIPPRYNVNSELSLDVEAGEQTFNLDLQSE